MPITPLHINKSATIFFISAPFRLKGICPHQLPTTTDDKTRQINDLSGFGLISLNTLLKR